MIGPGSDKRSFHNSQMWYLSDFIYILVYCTMGSILLFIWIERPSLEVYPLESNLEVGNLDHKLSEYIWHAKGKLPSGFAISRASGCILPASANLLILGDVFSILFFQSGSVLNCSSQPSIIHCGWVARSQLNHFNLQLIVLCPIQQ